MLFPRIQAPFDPERSALGLRHGGRVMAIFEALALACAPGVAVELLAAIADVESAGKALVVRDAAQVHAVPNIGQGIASVVAASDDGREVGVGLMGLTERRLRLAGFKLADGFDACLSLRAAEALFKIEMEAGVKRGAEGVALERIAIKSWWRPDDRFASSSGYEGAVRVARSMGTVVKMEIAGAHVPARAAVAEPSKGNDRLEVSHGRAALLDGDGLVVRQPRKGASVADILSEKRAGKLVDRPVDRSVEKGNEPAAITPSSKPAAQLEAQRPPASDMVVFQEKRK